MQPRKVTVVQGHSMGKRAGRGKGVWVLKRLPLNKPPHRSKLTSRIPHASCAQAKALTAANHMQAPARARAPTAANYMQAGTKLHPNYQRSLTINSDDTARAAFFASSSASSAAAIPSPACPRAFFAPSMHFSGFRHSSKLYSRCGSAHNSS